MISINCHNNIMHINHNVSPYFKTMLNTNIPVDKDWRGNIIFNDFDVVHVKNYAKYCNKGIIDYNTYNPELYRFMGHDIDKDEEYSKIELVDEWMKHNKSKDPMYDMVKVHIKNRTMGHLNMYMKDINYFASNLYRKNRQSYGNYDVRINVYFFTIKDIILFKDRMDKLDGVMMMSMGNNGKLVILDGIDKYAYHIHMVPTTPSIVSHQLGINIYYNGQHYQTKKKRYVNKGYDSYAIRRFPHIFNIDRSMENICIITWTDERIKCQDMVLEGARSYGNGALHLRANINAMQLYSLRRFVIKNSKFNKIILYGNITMEGSYSPIIVH